MSSGEIPPAESGAFSLTTSEAEKKWIDNELRLNGFQVNLARTGYNILKDIGFEMELSPKVGRGRFIVSERSCQPFGVLHGGTTAHIAEAIASGAGSVSRKGERVAGIDMNVNHLRAAPIGEEVTVITKALMQGSRIQVWEVKFEIENPTKAKPDINAANRKALLIAIARVTLIVGLPIGDQNSLEFSTPVSKL